MPEAAPLLELRALDAFYGDFQALFGVSMAVRAGQVVAVIGANGAGKSTLLRTIAGLIAAPRRDAVLFDGEPIGGLAAHGTVGRGIALVPEGRRLFPSLSVEENLLIGGRTRRPGPWSLDAVYGFFPALAARRRAPATSLSGGQQQMAAIGRALMSNPRLLLCDEVSLGLAPVVVRDIYARLPALAAQGTAMVIVEQDVSQALAAADRVFCLREGRVVLEDAARALTREAVASAYFGV
ncbi:ABC transporter ATP-binding protein [Muricoccus vinaceus]|uniref:ABC transporter ATP-binding protein n=1 Tax=Muricoccus vinaceus TaxID=424704 RepID=A0ABV6IW86_9PROT